MNEMRLICSPIRNGVGPEVISSNDRVVCRSDAIDFIDLLDSHLPSSRHGCWVCNGVQRRFHSMNPLRGGRFTLPSGEGCLLKGKLLGGESPIP
jgi:hypothetical protein